MGDFDLLLRGSTAGICLLFAALFWRTLPPGRNRWASVCFLAGVIAYLLIGVPGFIGWRPLVQLALATIAISVPFFFWMQVRIVFDDGFAPRWAYGLWLAAFETIGIARHFLKAQLPHPLAPYFGHAFRVMSILLVGHALWIVWEGRAADLVEARAKSRLWLIFTIGLVILATIGGALALGPVTLWPAWLKMTESAGMLVISVTFGLALLRLHPDFQPILANQPLVPPPLAESLGAGDPEAGLLARLHLLMEEEAVWSETG